MLNYFEEVATTYQPNWVEKNARKFTEEEIAFISECVVTQDNFDRKLVYRQNYELVIERLPLQELFEMALLKWITYDELKDYIVTLLNNEANNDLSLGDKKEYWDICMSRATQVVNYLKGLIGNFDPVPNMEASEHYASLHKANTKPVASGQPRRFTKAFIPWEAMIHAFKYEAYKLEDKNIKALEQYIDANYSRIEILRIVYLSGINDYTRGSMERISCFNAGAGIYDDIDAWLLSITITIGWGLFESMYEDITAEDIGILF